MPSRINDNCEAVISMPSRSSAAAAVHKHEQVARERVLLQHRLGQADQAVEALSHVDRITGQKDPQVAEHRQHGLRISLVEHGEDSMQRFPINRRRNPHEMASGMDDFDHAAGAHQPLDLQGNERC
jgi:hypothetical protein